MAFEPYLMDRFMGCYKAERGFKPDAYGDCSSVDKYKKSFHDRWNVLRQDPCKDDHYQHVAKFQTALTIKRLRMGHIVSKSGANAQTLYHKDYKFPRSHNAVDDCCSSPCPCEDELPNYCRDSKNSAYAPLQPWQKPCPPLDTTTTYRQDFPPHQVEPRQKRPPEQWDPCEHPLEECTTTRAHYTKKEVIPNGPANAEVIKHGLWSCSQFCKEFTDATTNKEDYPRKFTCHPQPTRPIDNFCIPDYPLKTDTETGSQFYFKSEEAELTHCFHPWLDNSNWEKPEIQLDDCTTYNHFYKAHPTPPPVKCTVESPNAIPFCSINHLCYSCFDPVPNQRPPLEMKDNDPWPYVKPCAIRYQDNLQLDPCAKFNDETTQKIDYTPKSLCRPNPNFAPIKGFIPPIQPFNDDTTMKVSYPAYSSSEYKEAKTSSGNPFGIKWGLNNCPCQKLNNCLPRFPSPYGHPLKLFNCQHCRCPCGPFDGRSTYNQDFHFRSPQQVEIEEEERCRKINVPLGVSLYRFDFTRQGGKKAEIMPPPKDKGYRCMHPCSIRDLDSLTRVSFRDFWKTTDRRELELYRGKPTIRTRKDKDCKPKNDCDCEDVGDEQQIIYQPVYVKKVKKPCPCQNMGPVYGQVEQQSQDLTLPQETPGRCRQIPYSGQNILNRVESTCPC